MDDTQTVFRMALAMMCADVTSHYSKWERDYWVTRLTVVDANKEHVPFTLEERTCAMDSLLVWADMRSEDFGKLLRRLLIGGEPDTYIRHGTQLELVETPHHGNLDQPRLPTPRTLRSRYDASKKRKG